MLVGCSIWSNFSTIYSWKFRTIGHQNVFLFDILSQLESVMNQLLSTFEEHFQAPDRTVLRGFKLLILNNKYNKIFQIFGIF